MTPQDKFQLKLPKVSYDTPFNSYSTEKFINTVAHFTFKFPPPSQPRRELQMNQESAAESVNLGNFLKIYFDFAYFLFQSPFRVVKGDDGKYRVKKWLPQQACCALIHILCIIRLFSEVRVHIDHQYKCKNLSRNPVQYFQIILDVASFVYKLSTMKRVWLNQKDYVTVLNYTKDKSQFAPRSTFVKVLQTPVFLYSVFSLITFWTFMCLFMGKNFIAESSSWSAALWGNQLVKLARYTFFASADFNKRDTKWVTVTSLDVLRAVVVGLCMLSRYIIGLFSDIFILSFTMTLWCASKSFSHKMAELTQDPDENDHDLDHDPIGTNWGKEKSNGLVATVGQAQSHSQSSWSEVYDHFRHIQRLSMAINTALGGQVTWYMVEAVMYYSLHLNLALSSFDIFVRFDLGFFYVATFGILFVSSDICTQLESIKLWISHGDNRRTIPVDEFSIVLHEMMAKDIGIRGSNILTITYSLLAMFFSTIVTYFIITIQQQMNELPGAAGNGTGPCDI